MKDAQKRLPEEVGRSVARDIVKGVDSLIQEAMAATRPLEVDPWRSRLFEFFVTAEGAGLVGDESQIPVKDGVESLRDDRDLSADSLCRILASRWGLDMAARESAAMQTRLPNEQLERMRVLWSVMRMWMEWSYAWRRWQEFHTSEVPSESSSDD